MPIRKQISKHQFENPSEFFATDLPFHAITRSIPKKKTNKYKLNRAFIVTVVYILMNYYCIFQDSVYSMRLYDILYISYYRRSKSVFRDS